MNLVNMGWSSFFEESFSLYKQQDLKPGRIIAEYKHMYRVATEYGDVMAEITGKLRYEAENQEDFPAVGDWVALNIRKEEKSATIHAVLPRKSKFSRKVAGSLTREQILASNIDTVFLVTSLNSDFNVRRLERYLILAWESGANPVIILSKADLCEDCDKKLEEVQQVAMGVPVHVISSIEGIGLKDLDVYIKEGSTVALLGSSGVGKSTLINQLIGKEVQKTKEVREADSKGKHTSTHREIFILPNGGLIIDTPGMRELQLWDGSEGITEAFGDVEEISKECSFRNCKHEREPGCAVRQALLDGTLTEERFESYKKLQKELLFMEQKQLTIARMETKKREKTTSKSSKDKSYLRTEMYD